MGGDSRMISMNAVIGILYDELEPDTYEGVSLSIGNSRLDLHIANPEEAVNCALWVAHYLDLYVLCSSSVDHFIMDGGDLGRFN